MATNQKMRPCPKCGSVEHLAVYTYDNGARHVECSTSCGYLGPACTSIAWAIRHHNKEREERAKRYAAADDAFTSIQEKGKAELRLWEVEHPYYMTEGNYFKAGCHERYPTWDAFESSWRDADEDHNWFIRWDWLEGEDAGAGEFTGDIYYRNGILMLQLVGQRKAYLGSHEVSVCRADEPRVREFLTKYWAYMQTMWAPFSEASRAALNGEQ